MNEVKANFGVEFSESEEYIEKGAVTAAALVLGTFSGGAIGIMKNPEAGITIGAVVTGMTLGVMFGMDSWHRATYSARNGRVLRAYLRTIESSLETALTLTIPTAAIGYSFGGTELGAAAGIITEAAAGLLIYSKLLHPRLAQAFRERNQVVATSPLL